MGEAQRFIDVCQKFGKLGERQGIMQYIKRMAASDSGTYFADAVTKLETTFETLDNKISDIHPPVERKQNHSRGFG